MLTIHQALSEVLSNDGKIDRFEAKVLRELILVDGIVSAEEQAILENAIAENNVDPEAMELLSALLMRFTSNSDYSSR